MDRSRWLFELIGLGVVVHANESGLWQGGAVGYGKWNSSLDARSPGET